MCYLLMNAEAYSTHCVYLWRLGQPDHLGFWEIFLLLFRELVVVPLNE